MSAARIARITPPGAPTEKSVKEPQSLELEVGREGRDIIRLNLQLEADGLIAASRLTGVGCPALLRILQEYRHKLSGRLGDIAVPEGNDHASMLMRELLLRARGEWNFPYTEDELCHCRQVPTAKVDQAVVSGCHSVAAVSKATSAGTSCGTCRTDIERVLRYRLRK